MRFRLSNGLSLGYRTRGAGRIVMFLHPIGTCGAFWDAVVARLADRYRCVTVDLRGHGDSDVPNDGFSLDDLGADVIELLRMERAVGAVIVGCQLGGMVAQGIALKAPELLAGIVLADTSHRQTPEGHDAMQLRADASRNGMPEMVVATLARWFPAPFLALNPPEVQACRAWLNEDEPMVLSWAWEAIGDLSYGERLKDIKLPALVLRGSVDASSDREIMQEMARLLPRGRYVELDGAGRVAPLEQPAAFSVKLREFLERDVGA
jgi:pimeloyl-ACP methyl ester carboxylesterase